MIAAAGERVDFCGKFLGFSRMAARWRAKRFERTRRELTKNAHAHKEQAEKLPEIVLAFAVLLLLLLVAKVQLTAEVS